MGSEISSCCGETFDCQAKGGGDATFVMDADQTANNSEKKNRSNAREVFYNGIQVELILQNQERLKCSLHLDRSNLFLLLRNEKKSRIIHIEDVKEILHTPADLERIEKNAGIEQHQLCAAIHLKGTANCIPLFFSNPEDKSVFVVVLGDLAPSLADG